MEELINQAKTLLPNCRLNELATLAERCPNEQAWEYALDKLAMSDYPNLVYFTKCLEGRANSGSSKYQGRRRSRFHLGRCPFSTGLICPGPAGKTAKQCAGESECAHMEWVKREMFGKKKVEADR